MSTRRQTNGLLPIKVTLIWRLSRGSGAFFLGMRNSRCGGRLSLPAEVDQPRDFAAEVFAVHDEVEEAVLLKELAALEPFRQLDLDRVPDRARAGEADQGFGLGDDEVAKHGEARGDAARRRVGQQADEHPARFVE